jgi:putative flavoprotein involved in K+ transport
MTDTDTVIVGAGHAGLAVSRLLSAAGHEHVVLERGRVGERWRSQRWDSLHLVTPSWMTRLPGWRYDGPDPDGYLSAAAFADFLHDYATSFRAPVIGSVTVEDVSPAEPGSGHGYVVVTDAGVWRARQVVLATGPHGTPQVPGAVRAGALGSVELVTAQQYRNPAQLPPGGVLVVGASASGVQIADELARAGRPVVLAVGRHTRMPRRYRGMDIYWWLASTGRLARTVDDVHNVSAARREPSPQLVGRAGDGNLDLAVLQAHEVRLTGRLEEIADGRAWFRDDLARSVATAERRMHRLLDAADVYAARAGLEAEICPPRRPAAIHLPPTPTSVDLAAERIGTVLLATGYRSHHPWLHLPITGPDGSIQQYRGITAAPGMYVVGQRFQHRRDSAFIDGARHDAETVVRHLLAQAGGLAAPCVACEEPAA